MFLLLPKSNSFFFLFLTFQRDLLHDFRTMCHHWHFPFSESTERY